MEKTTYKDYTFWREGDRLFAEHGGKTNSIRVIDDLEFAYNLQKTQILARDGAEGLYNWMNKIIREQFCEDLTKKILKWIVYRKVR